MLRAVFGDVSGGVWRSRCCHQYAEGGVVLQVNNIWLLSPDARRCWGWGAVRGKGPPPRMLSSHPTLPRKEELANEYCNRGASKQV